jgi:hypothetical protein
MPKPSDYIHVFLITLYFLAISAKLKITTSMTAITNQWARYRCNPLFMPFADNVEQNFISCTQTTMKNFSKPFLDPLHTLVSKLTDIAGGHSENLNSMRISQSNVRSLLGNNFVAMIGAFEMIGVEFFKNMLITKDLIAKIVGIVMSMMYIMESTVDTMQSTWNGPPGQTLRAVANLCFHPNTWIELQDGNYTFIKFLKKGSVLKDGSKVEKVLRFYNVFHYVFTNLNGIRVTEQHKVFSKNAFIDACMHPDAKETDEISPWLICLITSSGKIVIDEYVFLDWNES